MKNKNILDVAHKAKQLHFPDAEVAFAAGSVFRGEGNEYSDIDLVVLYNDEFEDVRRESIIVEGWPVEAFVHNVQAQNYFFDKDRINGMAIMLNMVIEGIEIPGPCNLSRQRKAEAQKLFEQGPRPLRDDEVRARRYHISDMLDDLRGHRKPEERMGVLAKLYKELGDFHLRAAGKWSGEGKALSRALKNYAPEIAETYYHSFAAAFSEQDLAGVINLAEDILKPYGGNLFDYKHGADPEIWRNFKGPVL